MDNELEDFNKIDSKTLAATIVAYRYLGLNKDRAKKSMQELLLRENKGDSFNYEKYIQDQIKELPDLSELKNKRKSSSNDLLKNVFGSTLGSLKK